MEDISIEEKEVHREYGDLPRGLNESHLQDLHSPAAAQKGLPTSTYAIRRVCGLPTIMLRMSCVDVPCRSGNEDQGRLA